ncbi:ATP-dependent sacrificial sulfur transferase LarE [Methanocalculus taiwanensis]|uniref:ATP-dependent sacrificial sulfur transferase LarE n=1 Tax=Methanocalculus taiwanensis TaxID=106207 RepID=A0ABD4TJZ5_9EURY|nr:ATP-dependent sacrificial sulfur transferase LarE [Methanocalculus taiwanensis]MCQ1538766.1 ATP-dependent sacrificial sulfur transferase LarE [Methanocalculus taiwanensis]
MDDRFERVGRILRDRSPVIVAYSGGVDSSLLAAIVSRCPDARARYILLDSPLMPRRAVDEALRIAEELGIDCEVVPFAILDDSEFSLNPFDRCAFCKRAQSRILKEIGDGALIIDGANTSDLGEFRPGLAVSDEEGIIHPFIEAGIGKQDVREMARECGYSFRDKPSDACLATRIPYGEPITCETLHIIEKGEEILRGLGFSRFRFRIHGDIARIEVPPEEFGLALASRDEVVSAVKSLGLTYATLDLVGFRSGSMDEQV